MLLFLYFLYDYNASKNSHPAEESSPKQQNLKELDVEMFEEELGTHHHRPAICKSQKVSAQKNQRHLLTEQEDRRQRAREQGRPTPMILTRERLTARMRRRCCVHVQPQSSAKREPNENSLFFFCYRDTKLNDTRVFSPLRSYF